MSKSKITIIDGKALAERWLDDVAAQVKALGAPLHLAAVCALDDPGLKAFVALKEKAARSIGIEFSAYFPESEQEARDMLTFLANDGGIHGVFVELPLPDGWDRNELLSLVPTEKDVDVITPEGEQSFYAGNASVLPPAIGALKRVLGEIDMDIRNVPVAVVGQGDLIGRPITHWLKEEGAEVSTIDVDTTEPATISNKADLVIAGTGVPGLVTDTWIKEGATVIDYGYAKQADAYVGDVDADSVKTKAGVLTPVPGGMGPLVIAATLENLLTLATK